MTCVVVLRLCLDWVRRTAQAEACATVSQVPKKVEKIKIEKEKLRPKPRAPILPSKPFEDKRRRSDRRAKHKRDLRRVAEDKE
jgi:hypothetical protein